MRDSTSRAGAKPRNGRRYARKTARCGVKPGVRSGGESGRVAGGEKRELRWAGRVQSRTKACLAAEAQAARSSS